MAAENLSDIPRDLTRGVMVGNVPMGAGAPIVVQSMTSVPMVEHAPGHPVLDVAGNLEQIGRLAAAGCEVVRSAVPNRDSIEYFGELAAQSPLPVVADVHFDHEIAIGAARNGAAKLRINPGNIGSWEKVDAVIEAAGEAGIPIRIGVNAGSLDPTYREKSGWSLPDKLVASSLAFVEHFEERGFDQIVLSAKAHDVMATVETYRRLSAELPSVPLHIGVTEAGTAVQGTVKSSAGLGILLAEGIGDTMRISLTADPVEEIRVSWMLLSALGLRRNSPELVSCPTCSRCQVDLIGLASEVERRLADVRLPLQVAVMGCAVNGPGEARDADIGVACGKDEGLLFAYGQPLRKVPERHIVDALFEEIAKMD